MDLNGCRNHALFLVLDLLLRHLTIESAGGLGLDPEIKDRPRVRFSTQDRRDPSLAGMPVEAQSCICDLGILMARLKLCTN